MFLHNYVITASIFISISETANADVMHIRETYMALRFTFKPCNFTLNIFQGFLLAYLFNDFYNIFRK